MDIERTLEIEREGMRRARAAGNPSAASDCYRWLVDGETISAGDQYAPNHIAIGPNDPSVEWFAIEHRNIGNPFNSDKFRRLRRKL